MNRDMRNVGTATQATEFVKDNSDDTAVTITDADLIADEIGRVPDFPHPFWHPLRAIGWTVRTLFGIASLVLLLSLIAAIPIVNLLALGYLLEVEGRVARSGRLRDAFPLLELAPRLGSIAMGVGLWLLPVMFVAGYAADAQLVDPTSRVTIGWRTAHLVVSIAVTLHICLALARGGSLGCFFRPLKNLLWLVRRLRASGDVPEACPLCGAKWEDAVGESCPSCGEAVSSESTNYWRLAERNVKHFVSGFRLKHHFSLGFRGFVGAFIWLVLPTALFAAADKSEGVSILLTVIGGVMLMLVFSWLPFLQARFAAENRLSAMFEWKAVRQLFARAPLAWVITLLFVYALSLPLYLSKIVVPARDAIFLLTPLFIVTIYPVKVLIGWTYHRVTVKRTEPAGRLWRWPSRLLVVAVMGAYVFLLFFTPFIGARGKLVLFEHHAFLLPVPF